jgi:hypothetical protein
LMRRYGRAAAHMFYNGFVRASENLFNKMWPESGVQKSTCVQLGDQQNCVML